MARIAVIGAGFAGLSAASALAAQGHTVTILDAESVAGGAARSVVAAGARVDVGPTILTDLGPLRVLFGLLEVPAQEIVRLERVDPGLAVTFPRGVRFALHADPARMGGALDALGPHARADWARLLELGARAERLAQRFYARGDVAGPRDLLAFLGGRISLRDVAPFVRHGTLEALLRGAMRTPALRALLGHFARFLGLEADRAPSVALVIPYLLVAHGVWYTIGGIAALAEKILAAALKRGVAFRPGEALEGLEVSGGWLRAVRPAGGRLAVDACVSGVDAGATAAWLPGIGLGRRVARLRPGLAARVAWWVVEGRAAAAVHHALHFDADPAGQPLYVATPTVTDPGLAPPGTSVVYAMRHGERGEALSAAAAEGWRAQIETAGQWPAGRVLAWGVRGGTTAAYGYAIGPGLLGSFRPSQRVGGVDNLFLAGQSVFPGPGIANVIRSGLRAAALADAAVGGGGRP